MNRVLKRIIAIMIAISMIAAALCAVSFTSYASDRSNEPANKLYAYVGTLSVDGFVTNNEPYAIVKDTIGSIARIGAAWDYDNIYITVAPAAEDRVSAVELTLGGAELSVKIIKGNAEISGIEGARAKTAKGIVELSIPLSEVTLDITDGVASSDITATVTAGTETADYSAELILTGRSPIASFNSFDGHYLNGYTPAKMILSVGDASGVIWNADTDAQKAVYKNNVIRLCDASAADKNVRINSICDIPYELISERDGGTYAISMDLVIDSLAYGAIPTKAAFPGGPSENTSPMLHLYIASNYNGNTEGPSIMITNDKERGLLATVPNTAAFQSTFDTFELGVELGVMFDLTLEMREGGSFAILVNGEEKYSPDHSVSASFNLSGSKSYFVLSLLRGAALPAGQRTDVTCSAMTISTLGEVDTELLASLAKNGAKTPGRELVASPSTVTLDGRKESGEYLNSISVGALTKVYAERDAASSMLYLWAKTTNIEMISFEIGEKKIALAPSAEEGADLSFNILEGSTTIEVATVAMNTGSFSAFELAIPFASLDLADGYNDIRITAERSFDDSVTLLDANATLLVSDKRPPEETTPEETTSEETTSEETASADTTAAETTPADSAADTEEAEKSGCSSSLAGYGLALVLGSAVIAAVYSGKKDE